MKKLKAGWVEGSAQDFLQLSDADVEYIETKLALGAYLKKLRQQRHLTQSTLASRLRTSQSRVAKMECGDSSVSVDLLLTSIYRLGGTRKRVAKVF